METLGARTLAAAPRETKRIPLLVAGIVLFIGSEAMFFSGLFGTYYTLRAQTSRPTRSSPARCTRRISWRRGDQAQDGPGSPRPR